MESDLVKAWSRDYEDYLHDESRRIGSADSISFPTCEAEVSEIINSFSDAMNIAPDQKLNITIQGARTGIVAGAVPQGGHVLNMSHMKNISQIDNENGRLTVQPGVLLSEIQSAVSKEGFFFPPDPTETSASIGGMVACNASGAMSFAYGPTRNWIDSLRVVLSDGSTLFLKRSENYAQDRSFSLITENGRIIAGDLPYYILPNVKSAAGYYVSDNMDLIDLFIGMEGTLGVVSEIGLRLTLRPKAVAGLAVFLPSEEAALKLVRILRGEIVDGFEQMTARPVAIEFFNCDALDMLRRAKSNYPAFEAIPALKPHFHTAIYTEFHGENEDELEEAVMQAMDAIVALGGNDDDTWYATSDREMQPLKAFRHAIPEAVNLLIDERKRNCPELTKLGTDMSVPDTHLETVLSMYKTGLSEEDLESVIFGHIGNNHVHVNILPKNMDDYERGKSLYLRWAGQILDLGGSVSAEHGIGKIKAPFLKMMYGDEGIAQMRALRQLFDPDMILNPGNLF